MGRLQKFAVFIGVGIACIILWVQFGSIDEAEKEVEAVSTIDLSDAIEETGLIEKINKLEKKNGRELTTDEQLSLLPEKSREYYQLAIEGNIQDIVFYGRVVDQDGKPVAGANVLMGTGGGFLSGGGSLARVSDAEGNFSAEVKGSAIFIQSVTHPDIDFKPPLDEHGNSVNLDFGFADYDSFQWKNYSSPESPFIVNVWRITNLEHVLHASRTGVSLEPDGRLYTINLLKKFGKNLTTEGISEGNLTVRYFRAEGEEGTNTDWWLELKAIDGGIIMTRDPFMNLAPESGYETGSIRFEMNVSDPEYSTRLLRKRIYFYSNGGKEFGGLIFDMRTKSNGPGAFWYGFKVNPEGSRNLALDPKKQQ
jgi:hypothetical protein